MWRVDVVVRVYVRTYVSTRFLFVDDYPTVSHRRYVSSAGDRGKSSVSISVSVLNSHHLPDSNWGLESPFNVSHPLGLFPLLCRLRVLVREGPEHGV